MPVSNHWKRELVGMGCSLDKIVVHHMGIDLAMFKYRAREIDPARAVSVLTVGRLVEKKGHAYALRAIAQLVRQGRDIRYTIAGDGPLRRRLETLAAELGIAGRVRFVGAVDQAEVEGIPLVLMEAMATGLPVVSTRHSGIGELVVDGRTGLLTPEKDVDAIAEKLRELIDNPRVVSALVAAARKRVEQDFNIHLLNKRLVELYRRIAAASPAR